MRIVNRWDYLLARYVPQLIPQELNISAFESNMDARVNCICCGKYMTFGKGYTSKEFQTEYGMGYCVCEDCYKLEIKRERRHNLDEKTH